MSSSTVDTGVALIQTTVTRKGSDIDRLVEAFLSNKKNTKKIIGLDTERAQKFGRRVEIVWLQLCDGDHCLVVQPPSVADNLPLSLFNFLNLPDFTFVGIDIKNTLMKLESEWGLTCKNAVELSPATWNLTNKAAGEIYLIRDVVSTLKPTSPVFDDWDKLLINKNQIKLAAMNAYFAFGIGNVLLHGFD